MALKTVQGDLLGMALEGKFDIIIHGCNCHNLMHGGIANQIRVAFPEAYEADCETVRGDKSKLGLFTSALIVRNEKGHLVQFTVVNAYTQYNTSRGQDVFEYEAFRHALRLVARKYGTNVRIGLPEIGMGLARGDRTRIMAILEEVAQTMDITLVVFSG